MSHSTQYVISETILQAITYTGTDNKKLTAKSIKPTQKKQNTIIYYYLHTHAHKRNTN